MGYQRIIYSYFPAGRLCASPGAMTSVPEREQLIAFTRHLNCDWGDVSDNDKRSNDLALRHGERLVSSYRTAEGDRFFIITEADRSMTMLLLADEY